MSFSNQLGLSLNHVRHPLTILLVLTFLLISTGLVEHTNQNIPIPMRNCANISNPEELVEMALQRLGQVRFLRAEVRVVQSQIPPPHYRERNYRILMSLPDKLKIEDLDTGDILIFKRENDVLIGIFYNATEGRAYESSRYAVISYQELERILLVPLNLGPNASGLSTIRNRLEAVVEVIDIVSQHKTYIISVNTPPPRAFGSIYDEKIWIDKQSCLPIKMVAEEGNELRAWIRVSYSHIEVDTRISNREFELAKDIKSSQRDFVLADYGFLIGFEG